MHVGARHASAHDGIEVDEVMRGIHRAWKRPKAQKAPAVDDEIKRMVDAVEPQTLKSLRDRALLLLGFAGAFRRSELVALDSEHLSAREEGLSVLTGSRAGCRHSARACLPLLSGAGGVGLAGGRRDHERRHLSAPAPLRPCGGLAPERSERRPRDQGARRESPARSRSLGRA